MSEELDQLRELVAKQPHWEMLAGALDGLPDAVVISSADGTVRFVNRMAELVFGYNRNELMGQTVDKLLPERFRGGHAGHRAGFWKKPRIRSMGIGVGELFGITKEGTEFPCEIMLSPYTTEQGRFVSTTIRVKNGAA